MLKRIRLCLLEVEAEMPLIVASVLEDKYSYNSTPSMPIFSVRKKAAPGPIVNTVPLK